MPNFASEPHPGFKSVNKVQSLNCVFKNWKTNNILQWGVGVHYLKVFWDILIQSMWLLHTNFDHHFFVWHDVTTDGRKMLICYPATGRCCAPPKSIDIKTDHFEHPPTPPPFALSFLRGVWFTLPWQFCLKKTPTYDGQNHTSSRPLNAAPPSHRCDLDAHGAASPSPASALCFAATPPRVCFGSAAQKAQPLGRNWTRKDDGGGRGRSGLGCQEFFPTKMRSYFTSVNEEWWQPFLVLIPGLLANFFSSNVSLLTRFQLTVVI